MKSSDIIARLTTFVTGCILVACCASTAQPQSVSFHVNRDSIPPVDSILRTFSRFHGLTGNPAQRAVKEGPLVSILAYPDRFGYELIQPILDGLERIVVDGSQPPYARQAALTWLATAGDNVAERIRLRDLGVAGRLKRIFERIERQERSLRFIIIDRMWSQSNTKDALEFLVGVAQTDRPEDRTQDYPEPLLAVDALSRMGARGRAALNDLRNSKSVANPRAKGRLEHLAKNNFRTR